MKTNILTSLLLLALVGSIGHAAVPTDLDGQLPYFETALNSIGFEMDDARIDPMDLALIGGDKYRLQLHETLFDDAWKISPYTRSLSQSLINTSGNFANQVMWGHSRTERRVRLGLIGNELEEYQTQIEEWGELCLAEALARCTDKQASEFIGRMYDEVPMEIREASALVLLTGLDALELREKGMVRPLEALGYEMDGMFEKVLHTFINTHEEQESEDNLWDDFDFALTVERMEAAIDWYSFNRGAALASVGINKALSDLEASREQWEGRRFTYSAATPLGAVTLSGDGRTQYAAGDYLLLMDTGGDDRYGGAGGTRSFDNPLSVLIDLGGNDKYEKTGDYQPSFGAGLFGYGFLIDAAGNDSYKAEHASQGFGLFGSGALWDKSGDDSYDGYTNVQGAGSFGSATLVDSAGTDRYHAYRYSQGFGFTRGSGLLLDIEGDDVYDADDEDLIYFSSLYGENHNLNMCQGMGYGRRGDYVDGHSWAGGTGWLIDGAGDDTYVSGIYGQGTSYWYGMGFCVDKSGNDSYRSVQYSTGAAPHFGLGVLQDDKGDDRYVISRRQALSHGRDFSIGWVEDSAGNDFYNGGPSALAEANVNSIALLWDKAGDDVYLTQGPSLGRSRPDSSGSLRDYWLNLAIFLDGGGKDQYLVLPPNEGGSRQGVVFEGDISELDAHPWARDGVLHAQNDGFKLKLSRGVFYDVE